MPEPQTNIKVAVRVRPYNRRELEMNQRSIVKVMDGTTLLFDPDVEDDEFFFQGTKVNHRDITKRVNKKMSMEFDRIFDVDANNRQIFEECTSPLVDGVLNGYNCSVFVYGATGAGKTFTMLGSESSPGLTFLTMRDLFDKIQLQSDTRKFDVGVSYLEVYNEQVMNLLTKSGPMKLREDSNGVVVSGLVLKPIHSAEELLGMLALGNSHRTQHPTDANAESSRSHAVFQVHIRMTDRKTGTKRTVKLSMIDLAGSERAASTKGIGVRFKEGASINKSLLALGNCINKLADGLKHIPYRDSNLTRILKDSLGGNCQTLMVANVSMSSLTYEDTYNTLKYASRAKKIRTTLRQNVLKSNMPKDFYVRKVNELMSENDRLKETNKTLDAKLALLQKTTASTAAASRGYEEAELKPWYSKMDAVYSSVIKTQDYVMGMQSKVKNLNFRSKLREEAEGYKKILTVSQSEAQEDLVRSTETETRFNNQIGKQMDELMRWRRKLQDAHKDLEKLKREIKDSKYANILQIYQKSKDLEIQNCKQDINVNHIRCINSELMVNSQKLRQAFTSASEILRRNYDQLIKSSISSGADDQKERTAEMQSDFEQLQRIVRSNTITFKNEKKSDGGGSDGTADDDDDGDNEQLPPAVKVQLNGKRVYSSEEDDAAAATASTSTPNHLRNKRLHCDSAFDFVLDSMDDTDSDDGGAGAGVSGSTALFKLPALPVHGLGASSAQDTDSNTTFELSATGAASMLSSSTRLAARKKNNLVSSILSQQISRAPANSDQLKKILLKSKTFSHQGLLKTVVTGVQKENKKYSPNRVRKSPRAVMSRALASTASFVRKQTTRTASADPPVVRINRAASFRVKK